MLGKVIFLLTQPHARVNFPSEKGGWHFEKSHFPTHSGIADRDNSLSMTVSYHMWHARRSFLSANGSWHFEKSHFTVPFSHAEGFSRAGMVAGILRKVILPLPPLYARIIFSSENGRWHFGKSNFPTKKISQATVERGIS